MPKKPVARNARAPRARLDVDERRAQLLAVGLEIFSTRAYDAVSIDDLARAAGISKGLLYHYFPTKRDLYVAGLRYAAGELLQRTFTEASVLPEARLRAGLDAYLAYVGQRGPAYAALLRGGVGSDPEVARVVDETRQKFLARLLEGLPIAQPAPLLRTALRGWIGFVEAASLDWVERRDVAPEQLRDALAELLVHLLGRLGVVG